MRKDTSSRPKLAIAAVLTASIAFTNCTALRAQEVAQDGSANLDAPKSDLLDESLEDLLTLESTSVAKKRQRVADSAAAVYVISQEQIRRSGADTIPDLLRGVPGVEVARQVNGGYAVSIRGFNSRLASSVLVMVDGRSQFVSLLSGVFWDQLQIPLGDIERIEVVRGPGAALWGSNSSNGVINIITRHSADTGGLVADVRAGSRTQQASLSYGGRIADDVSYRVYGNVRNDDGLVTASGANIAKPWRGGQTGLRIDWEPDAENAITAQTNYGRGTFGTLLNLISDNPLQPGNIPVETDDGYSSFDALLRWAHQSGDNVDWTLQAQYNRISRREFSNVSFAWNLADLDFGLHWRPDTTHDISVGVAGRILWDSIKGTDRINFTRPRATDKWLSGYVQDDITLIPDTLRLTAGTKIEYNNFTGFEFQPGARLFFRPQKDVSLWAAVTRGVRTPSRFERSARFGFTLIEPFAAGNPSPLPVYPILLGVEKRRPETVMAYEAGLRAKLAADWSLDIATYFNRYNNLTAPILAGQNLLFDPTFTFPIGVELLVPFADTGRGSTWGAEATLSGSLVTGWNAELGYSHFDYKLDVDAITGQTPELLFPLEGSPRHQFTLRNSFDLSDRVTFDSTLRHVTSLTNGLIPAYTELDARLMLQLDGRAELSVVGTNLLNARHAEFTQPFYPAPVAYVARSVSAQLRYRF